MALESSFNVKTVLFQTIQFSISTRFSSIQPIDGTLSGATTTSQNGAGTDGNEGILRIPQSFSIIGTSPSDCLVSCPGHSLGGESYPSAEKQSVYSTVPADWEKNKSCMKVKTTTTTTIEYRGIKLLNNIKMIVCLSHIIYFFFPKSIICFADEYFFLKVETQSHNNPQRI